MIEHKIIYCLTDGGRDSSGLCFEEKDCVVRAIATAYCEPYEKIHAELKAKGRENCQGINTILAMEGRTFLWGKRQREIKRSVGGFIKDNPIGNFVVRVEGHAFALIDG